MARSNIAVDDSVAKSLADEASRANKTMFGFSNDCLDAVLRILRDGGSIEEVYPYWLQSKMSKDVDGMPLLNRGIVDSMVREFFPNHSEKILKIFFDAGVLFGSYVKMKFKNMSELWQLVKLFHMTLPARLFEMDRVVDSSGSEIFILRYVSGISADTTNCFAKYFDGLFSCYSSDRRTRTSANGIIEMEIRNV